MSLVHTIGLEVSVHDASFAGAFFGCRVQLALWALSYLPVVHYPTNVLGLFPTMALGGCPRPEHWARLQVFLSMGEHAHDQGGGHDWTWAWPASSRHRPSLWLCVRASFLVLSGLRPFDDKCRLCCSLGVAPYLDGFVFGSRDVVEATGSGGPSVGHLSLAI